MPPETLYAKQTNIPLIIFIAQRIGILVTLLLFLLLADFICYQQALPLKLDVHNGITTLGVGSQSIALGSIGTPRWLQFEPHDPVIHEYQIDGTDVTNNYLLDASYLHNIAPMPYYQFQAWMRDLDGTSRWSDVKVFSDSHLIARIRWPMNGARVVLPSQSAQSSLQVQWQLRRPEVPMSFDLFLSNGTRIQVTLDRNNRVISVTRSIGQQSTVINKTFFPVDVLPFAAMVLDTILRTAICAIAVLLLVIVCEMGLVIVYRPWNSAVQTLVKKISSDVGDLASNAAHDQHIEYPHSFRPFSFVNWKKGKLESPAQVPRATESGKEECERKEKLSVLRSRIRRGWQRLTNAIHPVAPVMLVVSFIFVAWIARVQYAGEPHIYDASAYLFAAKMYATGHLSVPIPPASDRFPGPFMLRYEGKWFAQYPPGTSLTLVPGIWLGVPWLVEPVLGTFALLGIGLVAARLYNRKVATLAVVLGTLSPFYSYLAACYLSHAIALFYLVWGLWALLRFVQGEAGWNLPLAALLFCVGALTRDLVAELFATIVLMGVLWLSWRQVRENWRNWFVPGIWFLVIVAMFVAIDLIFNRLLTGNSLLTPRSLFYPADHWGFGEGVGFYGQHTLAAGFVNLDEILTILQIDLYGWPFYFTLAFLAIPFLAWKAKKADWFCLLSIIVLIGAYIGYFYHGIYLGPRYVFECMPFLLILTARGILILAEVGRDAAVALNRAWYVKFSFPVIALIAVLIAANVLYYWPRQTQIYQNYSGLPYGYHIDLSQVYHPPMHNAIVVTDDYLIYQQVLFPLNDPYLHDDVIYAFASSKADYTELQTAFPQRRMYRISIEPDGSVGYSMLTPFKLDSP